MAGPVKGHADYLLLGDYNAECSMCSGKFKASELIKHWQGLYRCRDCWEPRHPQEYVRAVPDVQTPPWTQHFADDQFIHLADTIVTEAYVTTDDLFGSALQFAIATEIGIPLITE